MSITPLLHRTCCRAVLRSAALAVPAAIGLASATAAASAGLPVDITPRYRAIVFPSPPGFASAFPAAFDASGAIVGHASAAPFEPQSVAVRTDGAALVELPSDVDTYNHAYGAGGSGGSMVVGMVGHQAAAWQLANLRDMGDRADSGPGAPLATLPGYFHGAAYDADASGLIVGVQINDVIGIDIPVYWPHAGAVPLELSLGGAGFGTGGSALAVNDGGSIAGVIAPGGTIQAVRWDTPTSAPVVVGPIPGAIGGEARAINAAGDIAGRSTFPDLSVRAMLHLREADRVVDLGALGEFPAGGTYSEALGINDACDVVGASSADGAGHGFLWRDGTLHDLNDLVVASDTPFGHVARASDIDNDGRIAAEVVIGTPPNDVHRIALLVPCAAADLDCDGAVDGADLGALLDQWGGPGTGDLNGDGVVDGADLGLLLNAWSR